MSDKIKHECGVALIRLLKPLSHYQEKYGTTLYGLRMMELLLQKMRNRGQDGAGIATIKLDPERGSRYISRKRSISKNYLDDLFQNVYSHFTDVSQENINNSEWLKKNKPYTGELLLGHLRYGTHSANTIETCHPFLRQNNWISRNLVLAGNFNLTNVQELFNELVQLGQYPKEISDTVTVLEKIGHFLDDEVQRLFTWYKPDGFSNQEITQKIIENLDVHRLLKRATKRFDGGYVMAGLIGHGDAFVIRDSMGIRPAYYYYDDEIAVVASERPAIQTAVNVRYKYVNELPPGHALIVKKDGRVEITPYMEQKKPKKCSFERIYFSRGTDKEIYTERKKLGEILAPKVLDLIEYDLENTIFSFVPNTAETSFLGLVKGIENHLDAYKKKKILAGEANDKESLDKLFKLRPRVEKIVVKDAKLRTFIVDNSSRGNIVSHAYDTTYGIVNNHVDTLVLVDDSIVRGTTLKNSLIKIVDRLNPKRLIFVSSAPQIRYPDCYGIDMSKIGKFIAFKALIAKLEEDGKEDLLQATYDKCKAQESLPPHEMKNYVKELYEEYTAEEISEKISELLTPPGTRAEVHIIFQDIEGVHEACPDNLGDWYFSGNYPTPGGYRVVNKSFINFMDKVDARAY